MKPSWLVIAGVAALAWLARGLALPVFLAMAFAYPIIFFTRPQGMEKIWRRKNISLQQGLRFQEKMTLARAVGLDTSFWGGQVAGPDLVPVVGFGIGIGLPPVAVRSA